jgi:hypothetical protein
MKCNFESVLFISSKKEVMRIFEIRIKMSFSTYLKISHSKLDLKVALGEIP